MPLPGATKRTRGHSPISLGVDDPENHCPTHRAAGKYELPAARNSHIDNRGLLIHRAHRRWKDRVEGLLRIGAQSARDLDLRGGLRLLNDPQDFVVDSIGELPSGVKKGAVTGGVKEEGGHG